MISHAKKGAKKYGKKQLLKSCKNSSASSGFSNAMIANSPFSHITFEEEVAFETESKSSDNEPQLDSSSVLEASRTYGHPSVIEKCLVRGDIALTFDDGISMITQNVLKILRREMIEDGHVVASHSYSHPNFDEYWPEGIQHEMNRAKDLFHKHMGKSPRFMRPPFGNTTPRTVKALHDLGYFIIRWNVGTNDWMHKKAPEKALVEFSSKLPDREKINSIRWQKNGLTELGVKTMINSILDSRIVLMHDIHLGIVNFLPRLISHARNLGYRFVSMDECLGGITLRITKIAINKQEEIKILPCRIITKMIYLHSFHFDA